MTLLKRCAGDLDSSFFSRALLGPVFEMWLLESEDGVVVCGRDPLRGAGIGRR
jgi:hypothetical protein